jgi:peptidoglycan/xylan/chitin deacetylase (PgdA/CDA1 family)
VKVVVSALVALLAALPQSPPTLKVAVTFDDLPFAGPIRHDAAVERAITVRLLDAFGAHRIPVTGFVIGDRIAAHGEAGTVDSARVALLQRWLDRGFELGNHTFSHADFHTTPLEEMEREVSRADEVLAPLLAERGRTLRYFRHPMLHVGRDSAARVAFEDFLKSHGYRIAPVTIDNDDYIFNDAYEYASERGATDVAKRIADAFASYMDEKFVFFERNSDELFGRQIAQILLLHANRLNADTFDGLATRLERRGYRFLSLDDALADPAYQSRDTYSGPAGITWLHRWALTKGMPKAFYAGEPDVPAFVHAEAKR